MTKSSLFIALIVWALPLGMAAQQHHSDALDDIAQHVPMASVVVLRACGVEGRAASWGDLVLTAASAYVLSAATTYGLKHIVDERRPDHSDCRAFPSGHATMAFAGASVLRHEYGHLSPWVSIGGYAYATLVAADRVRRDRHYVHDVCAGAAIGIAATELTYYINKRFVRARNADVIVASQGMGVVVRF